MYPEHFFWSFWWVFGFTMFFFKVIPSPKKYWTSPRVTMDGDFHHKKYRGWSHGMVRFSYWLKTWPSIMDVIWILHVFPSQYGIFNGILYGIIYRICEEVFDVSEMDIALRFGDEIRNGSPGRWTTWSPCPWRQRSHRPIPGHHEHIPSTRTCVHTNVCVYIYVYINKSVCVCKSDLISTTCNVYIYNNI